MPHLRQSRGIYLWGGQQYPGNRLRGLDYDVSCRQVLDEVSLQDAAEHLLRIDEFRRRYWPYENGADSPGTRNHWKYTAGTIYKCAEDDPSGHSTAVYVSENVVAAAFSHKAFSEAGTSDRKCRLMGWIQNGMHRLQIFPKPVQRP